MKNIASCIFCLILSFGCFAIGYLHFKEKMPPLNNATMFLSKKDRDTIDTKPYYRQSGIVFSLLGLVFLINAMGSILRTNIWFILGFVVMTATIIYTIVSTFVINRKR